MMIATDCPFCGHGLESEAAFLGKPANCPNCGQTFTLRRTERERPPWFYGITKLVCYLFIGLATIANAVAWMIFLVPYFRHDPRAGALAFVIGIVGFAVAELIVLFIPTTLLILADIGETLRRK